MTLQQINKIQTCTAKNDSSSVAVLLWRSLGPYHVARVSAAGKLLRDSCSIRTVAIELSDKEESRSWWIDRENLSFEIRTVAPGMKLDDRTPPVTAALMRILDELKPRYLAIAGYDRPEMRAALRWAKRHGAVAVMMSETKWDDAPRPWWKRMIISRYLRQFDSALVSGAAAGEFMVAMGMPRSRVFRQYGAVDNAFFATVAQQARAQNLRPRAGLPTRYFLACCRLIESRKNLKRLILAYELYRASVRESGPAGDVTEPWDLVILGDGPDRAGYEQLIRDRYIKGVHFEGFKQADELALYYANASCFVHPAAKEAWGLVVNEALASGLPVLVSSACGCAYDLVKQGKNGFVFDPLDVDALARLMIKLAAMSDSQRGEMGHESWRIIEHFGVERFAGGVCAAFGCPSSDVADVRKTRAQHC